jgi:signal recognition particle receptor subunit beta
LAFYDPSTETVTLRIVYDGLGTAGKTTNIRQLHALFTLARCGDIVVPEEHRGRTLFFDWLELNVGQIDEHPLRCQILTVPGQFAYAQRRWQLLRNPDAIVAVCDSSPEGLLRSRHALRFLRGMLETERCPDVPLLLQANKQDLPGALPGSRLLAELELPPSTPVIAASARDGTGVRETFMRALLQARERLRPLLQTQGLQALPRHTEDAEQLYRRMLDLEQSGAGQEEASLLVEELLEQG